MALTHKNHNIAQLFKRNEQNFRLIPTLVSRAALTGYKSETVSETAQQMRIPGERCAFKLKNRVCERSIELRTIRDQKRMVREWSLMTQATGYERVITKITKAVLNLTACRESS